MYKVEIEFPSKEHAEGFMIWLCEMGEQYYFDDCKNAELKSVDSFHYDDELLNIRGEVNTESDDNEEI